MTFQAALDKLGVVYSVKKYDRLTVGSPGARGIRYAIVKTYTMDAIKPVHALPAPSSTISEQPALANDKRFFSLNTKKQLTEVEV